MKTIEEIKEITRNAIEEREAKSIEACAKIIEDVIEPNILLRAKNGFRCTAIDSNTMTLSQINRIIGIYEEKGYEVKYCTTTDNIEIRWDGE